MENANLHSNNICKNKLLILFLITRLKYIPEFNVLSFQDVLRASW